MTVERLTPDDRAALAAELALGLLDGDELAEARRLAARDPAFRAEVARWSARFAPLLDTVEETVPDPAIWRSIEAAITPARSAANDDGPDLRRTLARWRAAAATFAAIAAALALALLVRPDPAPAPSVAPPSGAPMIAMIAGDDSGPVRLVANWDPARRQLVVVPAMKPPIDAARSMELWVIPADGKPRSMGVMPADGPMRGVLDPAMGALLQPGATLAISIEQAGGSATGAPAGPVVAQGEMVAA